MKSYDIWCIVLSYQYILDTTKLLQPATALRKVIQECKSDFSTHIIVSKSI